MLATDLSNKKIYQISLINNEVRAVDLEVISNPDVLVYNPTDKRVVWSDTKDKTICSVFLNGLNHTLLSEGKT